ncbi:Protein ENHANCED PSEUDOMONAS SUSCEPTIBILITY 1 [Linum grandiflorum]
MTTLPLSTSTATTPALCSSTLLLTPSLSLISSSLSMSLPFFGPSSHGFSQPFLAVQITELVDGIFVGCTMNHAVADGTAFWRFINSWSEICRDSGIIHKSPVFTRKWFLDEKHQPIRIPWTMIKDFKEDDIVLQQLKLKERVFHFSRHKLVTLKAQANTEAVVAGAKISSLQSLISYIWRAVIRNRKNPDPDRDARFYLPIGLRSRLQPKIPENYLGNALAGSTVVLKEKVLLKEKGLGDVATEINKVVTEHQNEGKFKEAVESWIENPQMLTIGLAKGGGMGLSSSPRYDIYGNDFGWGKPVAVRSGPGNKVDGKVTVFPGVDEGSMDVEICLSAETMERLGIDSEFMAAVAI